MADIFISYSRRNVDFVRNLNERFQADDFNTWVDWEDIPPTADWLAEIYSNIESSDNFLFVLSEASLNSPVCALEVARAIERNKRLIPIVIDEPDDKAAIKYLAQLEPDANIRTALSGRPLGDIAQNNWQAIARHNWLFFRDEDEFKRSYPLLVEALRSDLDYIREHTRLMVRAQEWDQNNRNPSFCLRGEDLQRAEQWLAQSADKDPDPTNVQTEYILSSRQAATRRQRNILFASLAALAITIVLAIIAFNQSQIAQRNENDRATQEQIAIGNAETAVSNAVTATVAQGEAEIRAEEALSLSWSLRAREFVSEGDPSSGVTLALASTRLQNALPETETLLAEISYQSRTNYILEFGTEDAAFEVLEGLYGVDISSDDQLIAVVGVTNSNSAMADLLILDYETGETFAQAQFEDFPEKVYFSPNDEFVAVDISRGTDETSLLALWRVVRSDETVTLEEIDMIDSVAPDISDMTWLPDSNTLMVGLSSGAIAIVEGSTGEVIDVLQRDVFDIQAIVASQRDPLVAFTDSNDMLYIFNTETFDIISEVSLSSRTAVLEFFPNDPYLAHVDSEGLMIIYDYENNQNAGGLFLNDDQVASLEFSADGRFMLASAFGRTIDLWDLETFALIGEYNAHESIIYDLEFAQNGFQFLSVSLDNSLILWDIYNGPLKRGISSAQDHVGAYYANDGQRILAVTKSGLVNVHDRESLATTDLFRSSGGFLESKNVLHSAISRDARILVYTDDAQTVTVFDTNTGEILSEYDANNAFIQGIAIDTDRNLVFTGNFNGDVYVWNYDTDELVTSWNFASFSVEELAMSHDNSTVYGYLFGTSWLVGWDVEEILTLEDGDEPSRQIIVNDVLSMTGVNTSDDGLLMVITLDNENIIFSRPDTNSEFERMTELRGHDARIDRVAFSNDNRLLASSDDDSQIIIWDLTTGEPIRVFDHIYDVSSMMFSEDDQYLLTAQEEGNILEWEIDPDLQSLTEWTCENRKTSSFDDESLASFDFSELTNPCEAEE